MRKSENQNGLLCSWFGPREGQSTGLGHATPRFGPHSAPQFCSPQISLFGWEQRTWLYMFTLSQAFLLLVKRKGNKQERYENNQSQLFYSLSSFPKLLLTKPEMVAPTPGRER